jgi:DNA-binding transcriptional ArsR family regulator
MKRNRNNNTCIRVCRDEQQIARCKGRVNQLCSRVQDFTSILQLLGNSVRMNIMILLNDEERLCVCDLSEILDMTIPAVSQHLKKLRKAELVDTEREGNTIYYYINREYKLVLNSLLANIVEPVGV